MGSNTNQLITKGELYNLGYTNQSNGNTKIAVCDDLLNAGISVSSCPKYSITPTWVQPGGSEITGIYASSTIAARIHIANITLPSTGCYYVLSNFSTAEYVVRRSGATSTRGIRYWYEFYENGSSVPSSGSSVQSGIAYTGIYTSNTELEDSVPIGASYANIDIPQCTTDVLNVYLVITQYDTSSIVYTVEFQNPSFTYYLINGDKCLKYSEVPRAPSKLITVKISEGVTGKTRANQMKFYFVYTTSLGGPEQTELVGEWNYGSNIDSSASTTISLKAPPLNHQSYASTKLRIWCGTTNAKQAWKYKLNGNSTFTSISSNATSVNLDITSSTVWPSMYASGTNSYLSAFHRLSSVEINIDN